MTKQPRKFTIWHWIFLIEFIAVLIGIAMPITPSKTGSDFSLADLFYKNQSFTQEYLYILFLLTF
jgi:hypothetical protein